MSERDEGVSVDGPLQLLKVLLRPDTLPHIVLLVLGTGGLYGYLSITAGSAGYAAIVFTSAMLAYLIIGLIGNNDAMAKMLRASSSSSFLTRIIGPVAIPIAITTILTIVAWSTLGKDEDIRNGWALTLASMFALWSIGQGLALRASASGWASGKDGGKDSPLSEASNWDIRKLMIGAVTSTGIITVIRGIVLPSFSETEPLILQWIAYLIGCTGLLLLAIWLARDAITPMDTSWTRADRRRTHRTGQLLLILSAWHLSSAWSRFTTSESGTMWTEEAVLVIITVISAVWAMTNRNRTKITVVTENTAVFWAIAFGFGYAGSITVMTDLSTELIGNLPLIGLLSKQLGIGSVASTLGIGHVLTALTLLLGFSKGLKRPTNKIGRSVASLEDDLESSKGEKINSGNDNLELSEIISNEEGHEDEGIELLEIEDEIELIEEEDEVELIDES
ncbi:MAG: hypothetical protein CMB13_04075 [Euryarchaeota archaeon]|nr:hypothetical protein [Euryarchaeota archaeon]|tara:strand:- start:798 stop:2144 length:1347 start_codon:yes stop_codon:yes gene_type:complete